MKYSMDFTGKVVVVTGARCGIGQSIALAFGEQGANVVCCSRRPCEDTVKQIQDMGGTAIDVCTDVSIPEDIERLVKTTLDQFGKIDVWVNNAGFMPPTRNLVDQTLSDFEHTLNVDVKGVFLGMKYAIPEMLKQGEGAIVNIASVAGLIADPGMTPYVAAKHAVVGLTKAAGIEYADSNIRINGIAPGFVATELTQGWLDDPEMTELVKSYNFQHRIADGAEIATMALFLASPMAKFMNGSVVTVDAGQTAH